MTATASSAPSREFLVTDFGAAGDGKTLDTAAIQAAIDAAAQARAAVVFPPGTYLSGTLTLRDNVTLYLRTQDDIIQDLSFQGSGCAISKASASLLTSVVKGKTRAEVKALFADPRVPRRFDPEGLMNPGKLV